MLERLSNSNSPLTNQMVNQRESSSRVIEQQNELQEKPQEIQSKDDIEKIVKSMNEFLKPANTHLKFEFHDDLQEYYVTIVDNKTNEVIKEIPSKKLLDMYAVMTDYLGLLVDKKI